MNICKPAFALLITAILWGSCTRPKHVCSYNIYYSYGTQIATKGFMASELDTIIIARYEGGQYPGGKLGADTLYPTPYFAGDTAFLSRDTFGHPNGFAEVEANVDFHIILPGVAAYMITGASVGPSSHTWEQDTRCGLGAGEARIYPLLNIHIDGMHVYPDKFQGSYNPLFIYLVKP